MIINGGSIINFNTAKSGQKFRSWSAKNNIRRYSYQEEEIHKNIKIQCRKLVTLIGVIPHEDLYW